MLVYNNYKDLINDSLKRNIFDKNYFKELYINLMGRLMFNQNGVHMNDDNSISYYYNIYYSRRVYPDGNVEQFFDTDRYAHDRLNLRA